MTMYNKNEVDLRGNVSDTDFIVLSPDTIYTIIPRDLRGSSEETFQYIVGRFPLTKVMEVRAYNNSITDSEDYNFTIDDIDFVHPSVFSYCYDNITITTKKEDIKYDYESKAI